MSLNIICQTGTYHLVKEDDIYPAIAYDDVLRSTLSGSPYFGLTDSWSLPDDPTSSGEWGRFGVGARVKRSYSSPLEAPSVAFSHANDGLLQPTIKRAWNFQPHGLISAPPQHTITLAQGLIKNNGQKFR